MILADKITEERKKNGWSQEELANQFVGAFWCQYRLSIKR